MKRIAILLLVLLLVVGCLAFTGCQSKTNITRHITSKDYFYSTSENGRAWTIRCFVDTSKFNCDSVDRIEVNINGTTVSAIVPSNFGTSSNYFEVEYLDTKNSEKQPTIRSCYVYYTADGQQGSNNNSSELTVIIIVGVALLLVGAVVHFVAVSAGLPILSRIAGAVFLICVVGAFAIGVTEGFVLLAFFAVYLIACKAITKFFFE